MNVIEIKVPSIGESVTEVTLAKWLVEDGAKVKLDQALCEFESDKATFELPAEKAGRIKRLANEGDDLSVGAVVAQIDVSVSGEMETPQTSSKPSEIIGSEAPTNKLVQHPAPAAAKLMREHELKVDDVQGSGKEGRITKGDVLEAISSKSEKSTSPLENPATNILSSSDTSKVMTGTRPERREKMSRMRRTIAKRLVSAKNETAMLTTFNEADMSKLMELRQTYNEKFQAKYGIKLGFMSVFAKACAQVFMEMPEVNAFIDGDDLIYHDYVAISMAISTPTGLVVPPIHNVESIKLHEFEIKLKELAEKARGGKLSLEEMTGGTFTITNGGVFGSLMSTPIINEPQSAILGLHAIKDRPVAINGQVVIRPMMYLALSYDHRVIDGSSSVGFLVKVKEIIEDPMKLFLEI